MKKFFKYFSLAIVVILGMIILTGCKKNVNPPDDKLFTVTLNEGLSSNDKLVDLKKGDKVTIKITIPDKQEIDTFKVDNNTITVTGDSYVLTVSANHDVKVTFKNITHAVKFINYDGTTIKTMNVNDGENAVIYDPTPPYMHNFKGWSESLLNITENKTIHAVYEGKPELFNTLEMSGKLFLSMKADYKDDQDLKYVAIPSVINDKTVYAINEEGFLSFKEITKIVIPEGIVIIYEKAFYGCDKLQEVYIPKSVDEIREDAFVSLNSCYKFDVHPDNENYSAVGDALYDKDVTKLINYPRQKTITELVIPSNVTEIMKSAFHHNFHITKITLPANLQIIADEAFASSKITSITIPGTVKEIGKDAFMSCSELETLILEEGVEISNG